MKVRIQIIELTFSCHINGKSGNIIFNLDAKDKDKDHLKIITDSSQLNFLNEIPIFELIKYLRADRIGPKVIQNKNDEIVIEQQEIGSSGEYRAA